MTVAAPLPPGVPPPPGYVPTLPPPTLRNTASLLAGVPACPPPVKKKLNARKKGQRGEREVIDLLQGIVDSARKCHNLKPVLLQRNTLQAHAGGHDIFGLDSFSFEVKFQECDYNPAWWAQALRQAEKANNAVPVLLWRKSRQPWTVKFRAYVNTPGDRDQVQMDLVTNLEDFLAWFSDAYDEACSATA